MAPVSIEQSQYETLYAQQFRSVGSAFLQLRPLLVGPGLILGCLVLWRSNVPTLQLRSMIIVGILAESFFFLDSYLTRTRTLTERWLLLSMSLTVVFITCMCFLSGGTASPMLVMYFAPVVTTFAAFGQTTSTWRVFGLFVGSVLLLLGLSVVGIGQEKFPLFPQKARYVMSAVTAVLSVLLLRASVAGLTSAHKKLGQKLDHMRVTVIEEMEAKHRSLELVGARVAHEIKNPLAAIKGLVQLIHRDQLPEKQIKRLEVVLSEVDRINQLIQDYLSFSKPFEDIKLVSSSLDDIVEQVVLVIEAKAADKGIVIKRQPTRVMILADREKLVSALLNVLINAVEASAPHTMIEIKSLTSRSNVELSIQDHGSGMTHAQLQTIGIPFVSGKSGGTGLGVTLAKSIITQHGGTLSFTSTPGQGTTAIIALPLEK